MKVYKLFMDVNNYQSLVPQGNIPADFFSMFDGRKLFQQWNKVEMELGDASGKEGDVYGFKIPVLSERARKVLEPLIQGDAEMLPFEYEGQSLYGLNTITVIDALDRERALYKTFSDKKRIMLIEKYAFNESMISKNNIFKIADEKSRYAFVSEAFAKAVKDNELKGFDLKLVYESEESDRPTSVHNEEKTPNEDQRETYHVKSYTDREAKLFERFIAKKIGKAEEVFHEIVSQDIHIDILVIQPSKKEPYYKLVTMGAGALKQNLPKDYNSDFSGYAEYCICLPANWNVHSDKYKDYWPIQMLKKIARIPIEEKSWLSKGHTVSWDKNGASFDESTELNSLYILNKSNGRGKPLSVKLSSDKTITILQLYPLYQEELDYINNEGWANYVNRLPDEELQQYQIIRPNRKNYCK